MEKTEINLKIPSGYRIIEKTKEVDLYTACDILRSRKHKHITSAKRVGDKAILTSHRVVCPHCGRESYAYAHYHIKYALAYPKKSEYEISKWANIQLSLEGAPEEKLDIQELYDYSNEYICRNCGYSSEKSSAYRELKIECFDKKVSVSREIRGLSELVSLKWLKGTTAIGFPVWEQVTFDFDSRTVYIKLLSNGTVVCTEKVTEYETNFSGDLLIDLFSKSNVVKRTVRRCFERITGYKVPFTTKELGISEFVNFVRFAGFPKDFYDAVPFWDGTRVIDESFKEITDNLQNPESAINLLERSSIPFCKSVKRLFAKRSGLFFYLKECEFLYGLFNDVNLFCTYMNKKYIFGFLSRMHYYENPLKIFLTDFLTVLGKKRFVAKFSVSNTIISYAIFYASLSDYVRKKEQEKWAENIDIFIDFYYRVHKVEDISVPMANVNDSMKDCVIEKYRFKFLRIKQEYVFTGNKMHNCLVNWDCYSNPVVAVYKGNEISAAMEIFDDTVIQARACKNESIEPDTDVYNAIEKWCKRNNIKLELQQPDLPF